MSELNLEQQVEKLEYAVDLYKMISESNDKGTILSCLKQLSLDIGILSEITLRDWIIDFNKGKRNDLDITKNIGYRFLKLLDKENSNLPPYLKIDLGLSILDLYLKKTKEKKNIKIDKDPNIQSYELELLNPFLELHGCILIDKAIVKDDQKLSDEEKKFLDNISDLSCIHVLSYLKDRKGLYLDSDIQNLIHKGYNINKNSLPFSAIRYKRAKSCYKEAFDLCAQRLKEIQEKIAKNPKIKLKLEKNIRDEETTPFRLQLSKYLCFRDLLSDLISYSNFFYTRQRRLYNESLSILDQKFPVTEDLTCSELEQLCESLNSLENKVLKKECVIIPTNLIEDSNFILLAFKEYYLKLIDSLKKKKVQPRRTKLLSKIYTNYSRYISQKMNCLNKALNLDKTNIRAIYGLAMYYEECNNEKKALEMWNKLVNVYFKRTDKINIKKFKDVTNEVGKITDDNLEPFLFDHLIIKRSKTDMSKEYNLMVHLYKINSDKNTIPKPVVYIQYKDGYNYLIMRETDTKFNEKSDYVRSLAELMGYVNKFEINSQILNKIGLTSEEILINFKVKYLKDCFKKLEKIQQTLGSLNLEKERYSLKDIVEHKISKRLGHKGLVESLEFLIEQIDHQEKCFTHGDYHPGNVLVKYNKCIPIDFECVNYLPVLYDVSFLLEHKEFIDLKEEDKKELVAYFFNNKNMNFSFKESQDYDYMALFINLRLASISSRFFSSSNDVAYKEDIKLYVKKANEGVDKMLIYTTGEEYYNLNKLKQVLMEINI